MKIELNENVVYKVFNKNEKLKVFEGKRLCDKHVLQINKDEDIELVPNKYKEDIPRLEDHQVGFFIEYLN